MEALCENKILTTLKLINNLLGPDSRIALADTLHKNNSLIFLNISFNKIGANVGKILFESLKVNTTLTSFQSIGNDFEFEEFKKEIINEKYS